MVRRYASDDLPAMLRADMGIWAEQVDEDFATVDRLSDAGALYDLLALRDDFARWVRTSPCPNAIAQLIEHTDAAIAVTARKPLALRRRDDMVEATRYALETQRNPWDVQREIADAGGGTFEGF